MLFRMLFGRPGLLEQFLRHRLLQSLPDPSRSNHGELPKTCFGNSELAALLQNPTHIPDEMSVEQSVARPARGPVFHSHFRFWLSPSHPRPRWVWLMLSTRHWNQQRLQIFLAVSSFLPGFLPEFQVLVSKFSRYRIVLPADGSSFDGVNRDVKLFSRTFS